MRFVFSMLNWCCMFISLFRVFIMLMVVVSGFSSLVKVFMRFVVVFLVLLLVEFRFLSCFLVCWIWSDLILIVRLVMLVVMVVYFLENVVEGFDEVCFLV